MAVVESSISFLVDKLRDVLVEQIILLRGVEDQIEWVETEFRRIECFLKDAHSATDDSERVKNWRRELRDVADCAEDAVDIFFLKVDYVRRAAGCWGGIRRAVFIFKELAACREVASKVERIKLKLRSIWESRMAYGIECIGRAFCERTRRLPSLQSRGQQDFVGFEKELSDFIQQLTIKEQTELCIFSVVGMGGSGKTTLTAKLYKDFKVVQEFDVRAWATVSQQYAVRDIFLTVYWQIAEEKARKNLHKMDGQQLKEEIMGLLKDRRYLVVLDDVWTKDAWDELQALFPPTSNGSRVVLTTRHKDVASHADARSPPLELRYLTDEESWQLFCKKAFDGPEDPRLPKLEKLGRQIVKKCNGLPLAIVSMGGALAGKDETEWNWKHALSSISWQLGQGEARISRILRLSYSDLPYELKPCFLYSAIFPAASKFKAQRLIRMWAAEGLLRPRDDETVEEVGEDCLRALIQRSMIQMVKRSSTGGIKTCRVHNLLRDLAVAEAQGDKFLRIHCPGKQSPPSSSSLSAKARRLAIHESCETTCHSCISSAAASLRSVFIYPKQMETLGKQQQRSLYHGFKLLRLIDLHHVEIKDVPDEIGDLIHLRYFAFKIAGTTAQRRGMTSVENPTSRTISLPSSMANLRNLQTLECHSPEGMTVPSSLENLREMRHLRLKCVRSHYTIGSSGSSSFRGQPRIERMCNLQSLTHVTAGKWVSDSLGKLSSLRKLGITLDLDVYYQSIAKLESLQSLSIWAPKVFVESGRSKIPSLVPLIHLHKLQKLSLRGEIETLPDAAEFPPNLRKLSLATSRLDQKALVTIGKLPKLCILKLLWKSYMGKEMIFHEDMGFHRLEYLRFEGLLDLEKLRFEKGAMPSLVSLNVTLCAKLKMPPEGHEHLASLKWKERPLNAETNDSTDEEFLNCY